MPVREEPGDADAVGTKPEVVTKATVAAMRSLGLSQQELTDIIHVSAATASRLANGQTALSPDSAEGRLALIFLRVFRSLDTLVGGDTDKAKAWLRADNRHLGAVPLERLTSVEGLVHVAEYLDAMRGKA